MIKTSISLQDLRRRIYVKAKAEKHWRFWGLYVHVCKMETLWAAYDLAKANDGAPGIDGVTFGEIEAQGEEGFLKQIHEELRTRTYRPLKNRKKEIPKDGGKKVRVLSIPSIRDRVVQGALKLILEPVFEADFQEGSFGYRPKRSAHQAVARVAKAIVQGKTHVIDVDLKAFFDNVSHSKIDNTPPRATSEFGYVTRTPGACPPDPFARPEPSSSSFRLLRGAFLPFAAFP
jgi:RNA-directed DNA polymerase